MRPGAHDIRSRPALLDALAAAGTAGRAGLVVLVDVDELREHNRLHGLAAGDALLEAVAARLGDDAFHYLGDAFALVALGPPGAILREVAVRLDALYADPPLACSFGAAHLTADGPDPGAVLAAAERRLIDQQGRGPLPEDRILEALDPLVAAAWPTAHARAQRAHALAPVIAGRLGVKAPERERIRRCAAIGGDPELAPLHAQLAGLAALEHTHAVLSALDAALRDETPLSPDDLAVQAIAACIPGVDATTGLEPRVSDARDAQLSAHDLAPTLVLPPAAEQEPQHGAAGDDDPHAQRLASLSRLHSLIDAAGHIDDPGDLDRSLQAVAQAISETLGFRNVVINLYRPEWDDYIVGTIFGAEEVRDSLLGATYDWSMWEQVLDERFLHRGTYLVYAGEYDWSEQAGRRYVPEIDALDDPRAWQAEDEVFVTFHQSDGSLGGVLNVGAPVDGLRPSDSQLDTLVVVARHAARAVERAQAASVALSHRRGLEQLLAMSTELTRAADAEGVLTALVDGVGEALGFASVSVHVADGPGAPLRLAARSDRTRPPAALTLPTTLAGIGALLTPDVESAGCYLLTREEAHRRLPVLRAVAPSRLNGRGPHAWTNHWLLVPLCGHDGRAIGVVVADDPQNHLLPTTERLQALRLFANQAANALETLGQREQLRVLAERDPLTRLLNRRALMADLEEAVAQVQAEGHPAALAYCDLDGFKRLNDRHGHSAGDDLLRTFAEILTDSIRPEDRAYRVGGDEFALLLCGCDEAEADRVVARVLDELARRSNIVGASFGVAVARTGGLDAARLLHSADSRMYERKRASVARSSA